MAADERKFRTAPARRKNCILGKNIRISVLSNRLFRLEWSEDGVFEDRQTLKVVNRDLGPVSFLTSRSGERCQLSTDSVKLEWHDNGAAFSAENLKATFLTAGKRTFWSPGADASGNLRGTCRTLDGCNSNVRYPRGSYPLPKPSDEHFNIEEKIFCDGLVSRDGWSLVDDSGDVVIVPRKDGGKWVAPRSEAKRQDWYLFCYGHEYSDALRDGAKVFGTQPVIPRYALGYWYCRYWAYTDLEIEKLIADMRRNDIPMDVMVIDMDWHLEGWTGYTWDRRYFPDPDGFLARLHKAGVKVALNLHPAEGVGKHEAQFPAMCKAMGLDPKKNDRVPFDICDPKYMKNYFELLHHPEEKRGIDFWWMDWQQGESTAMKGLDTLPWINQLHWEDMVGRADKKRPLIFSRFGDIGAGRYAIGFSGDTYSTWESLAYQPWFTATAANVLYGYWSHDLGGHICGEMDPELYLRWIQYGIYSPIVRTHSTKTPFGYRRFWIFPEEYRDLMSQAIRDRYAMIPYLYSELQKNCADGYSLCMPLYYADPEDPKCYEAPGCYFFGREMIVSPVTAPVDKHNEQAEQTCYLPKGEWFDTLSQSMVKGGKTVSKRCMLNETPLFVRAGTILPGTFGMQNVAPACLTRLAVIAYPGKAGEYELIEDDGISTDYQKGRCVRIRLAQKTAKNVRTVTVKYVSGNYSGFTAKRVLEVRLPGCVPPERVTLGRHALPCVYNFDSIPEPAYRYDGAECTIVVRIPECDLKAGVELKFRFADEAMCTPVAGVAARFRRLKRMAQIHNSLNPFYAGDFDGRLCQELSHAAERISLRPETFVEEMNLIRKKLPRVTEEMKKLQAVFKEDGRKEDMFGDRMAQVERILAIASTIEK